MNTKQSANSRYAVEKSRNIYMGLLCTFYQHFILQRGVWNFLRNSVTMSMRALSSPSIFYTFLENTQTQTAVCVAVVSK